MALPKPKITPQEYLAFEREAEIKHEFLDGEIYAMTGASQTHIVINWNITNTLGPQLRRKGCRGYGSDLRVRVGYNAFFYPDLTVVCGAPLFDAGTGAATLLNPTCIIEILSPSTEQYDRGAKFLRYQQIDSLAQLVFVNQGMPLIECYTRQDPGGWLYTTAAGLEATLPLESVGCALRLSEVYEEVALGPLPGEEESG
ncbi:MAG: Uma2 family endonuclease [Anaerolineae bacterium]|nr:Uma2 family endonuclease [Anaerolineae bacterium]NUQ06208.1 Uma2 family endonuclease [Anaerolineae bacterium]